MTNTPDDKDTSAETPALALPAPVGRRVLALTEAGAPLARGFVRLLQALRDTNCEIVPLALPRSAPEAESAPTLTELKRGISSLARDLVRGLRGGDPVAHEPWIVSQLKAVEGKFDAVVATDPQVAKSAFVFIGRVFPDALRVGCDYDYHLDPEWQAVELDALVVAHPALATDLPRVREGRARIFVGGPVTAPSDEPTKTLHDTLPQVAISFSRLDPGDVDPLLFQLSLAKPERFSLLFLPSQRSGVDELVRARAGNYGLRGKRPKSDSDIEAWIRGSSLLVGFPSPGEAAAAVAARVPILYVANEARLSDGDRFLLQRGALISEVPITIAVHVEGLLPGGGYRVAAEQALSELEPSGARGAADAVLSAISAGRPEPTSVGPTVETGPADDDLEDIGGGPGASPPVSSSAADMPLTIRRAYLKEIILQQQAIERNLMRAKAGLETWQKRVRLARTAGQDGLADKAIPRVEGLMKVIDKLDLELRHVQGLRERFASSGPLSAADREAVARFMSPATAASIDRGEAPDSAFTQLEIEDALAVLKRKLEGR